MKKLLTMMVSCASALFAMADVQLPTVKVTFDGYNTTEGGAAIPLNTTKDDNNGTTGISYWYSTATESEAVVTNNGNAYLMLDTSSVLQRTIGGYTTTDDGVTFASKSLSDGEIYFDSRVQFTATEDNVTPSEGDKLVVWLRALEGSEGVEGSTNLMITAGNGLAADGKAIPANYTAVVSGVDIEPNSWHRLTIKAFGVGEGDERVAFFNVYIDGSPVTGVLGENQVTDFQSLIAPGLDDAATITSVGFKGTGAVDDLLFTNEDPLGFPVKATIVDEDKTGAFAKYSVDGSTWLALTSGSEFTVPASTTNITFKVYTWDNYKLEGGTITSEIDSETQNIAWIKEELVSKDAANITLTVKEAQDEPETTPFSVTIAGVTTAYATLAEAIAKANGETITLTENATLTGTLSIGEGVTAVIDLAGKTLTAGTVENNYSVVVKGDLKITDSKGDGEMILPGIYGIGVNGDNAKLVLEIADFIGEDADYLVGLWSGSVTVNSGTFVADYNIINVFGGGKAVVNDGTFTTQGDNDLEDYDPNCVFLSDNADAITVNGGMFSTTFNSAFCKKGFKLTEEKVDNYYNLVAIINTILKDDNGELTVEGITSDDEIIVDDTWVIDNDGYLSDTKNDKAYAFAPYYKGVIKDGVLKVEIKPEVAEIGAATETEDGEEVTVPAITIANGNFTVTIPETYTGLKYKLQYKASLTAEWDDAKVGDPVVGSDGDHKQLSAPASEDAGFYRVVVED